MKDILLVYIYFFLTFLEDNDILFLFL